MRALILLAVIGLMTAARSFEVTGLSVGSATALTVGYLLLSAYLMGWLAKQIHMPKLTGYLLAGMLAGESLLSLIPEAAHGDLKIFTGVAVSLIALTAGCGMELRTMRPLLKTIGLLTLIAGIGTKLVLILAAFLLRGLLPFTAELDTSGAIALAAVLGVVLSTNSPAVVVALRTEMSADGPLSRTVLGAVVTSDLLSIVLFGVVGAFAAPYLGSANEDNALVHLLWHIGGSFTVGGAVAAVLWLYLRFVGQSTALFVVALAFVVAEVGQRIGLDPMLVSLAAGILVRNLTRRGDALVEAIEGSSLPVYLVFFAAAGSTIHLDVLPIIGLPALAFVLIRALMYVFAGRLAARIAGAEPAVQRYVGVGLLPQAGLALALALLMAKSFPLVGEGAATLVLGVVAVNEMIMPILYRQALVRAGEAGKLAGDVSAAYPVVPQDSTAAGAVDDAWDIGGSTTRGRIDVGAPEAIAAEAALPPPATASDARTGDTIPP